MFNKVTIRNFRNFHKIEVELTNKNIVIGMNDVGKSNFLHALRLIFDKKVRFEEICDTDFHQKNTSAPISIIITLDISDESKEDVQKILACVKEARTQEDSKLFYIKLEIESNLSNGYLKHYTWGDDLGNLKEIKTKGLGYLLLDDVFNVIYIPSHIETAKIFNDIRRNILQEIEYSTNDEKIKSEIFEGLKGVNDNIEKLSSVKNIAEQINKNLEIFDESYKVKITSQSVVDDLHKQLKIFTYEKDEDILFPASGDGRQKKIMYAMLHYFLQKETRKIPLLILEEPENHLYLTAQIDLSDTLFSSTDIKYIFMSSHSAQLLYYINSDCSLIRLYRSKKISGNNNTSSNSSKISEEYHQLKRIYVEDMSKGYFADCVLLVEGYSEKLLCDTILKKVLPQNFYQKIYVLPVLGTNFKP
ncbi:AAA family ATPase [Acinetobacter baumannii]|nr:AAA family ATPase [Acinetobacter baumannii]